ncbi:MAG: hypothetical protein HYS12_13635 [Planctomycetes bacterium]|nr:hypothetical protein [Planctomycetota bacterium]
MSKKNRKKRQQQNQDSPLSPPPAAVPTPPPPRGPAFSVDAKVRVKAGVKDPDNPDIPIGGWCGTVAEVETSSQPCGYLVRWDQRTLGQMHPVFVKRCQRDDLEVDRMWLDESDLEADRGEMLPIEQPTAILTPPLDPRNQDDRVRTVFGLTADDPLPAANEEALGRYHAFLSSRLTFPFEATIVEETGPLEFREGRVTVRELLPLDECDTDEGLLCDVRLPDSDDGVVPLSDLEGLGKAEVCRLVGDYAYWFTNYAGESDVIPFPANRPEGVPGEVGAPPSFWRLLNRCALAGAAYGATVGAIASVQDGARLWISIGAGGIGLLLGLVGWRYGAIVGASQRMPNAPLVGALLGVLVGGVFGVLFGALVVAPIGSIPGSIAGVLLASGVASMGGRAPSKLLAGLGGAAIGGVMFAFYTDRQQAALGLVIGTVAGAASAAFLVAAAVVILGVLMSRRGP